MQYDLLKFVHNGYVFLEVRKGMYGLPQAGILAYNLLVERLAKHCYSPCPTTTGLWRHSSRPVSFVLTVDDFGVKYVGKHNAMHLIETLKKYYEVSIDWSGTKYCGLDIAWNYPARSVRISMPLYIPKLLHKLQHPQPVKPQHSPHPHIPIVIFDLKNQGNIRRAVSGESIGTLVS